MDRVPDTLPLAFQYHQAGDFQKAQRLYQEILAEQPNCAPAWHFLGLIAHQARRYDEAIRQIRRSLELMPNYAEAHRNLGIVLHDARRYEEATYSFRRVLELQPDNAEVHDLLGLAYYLLGDLTSAMACYQRAIDLDSQNATAYHRCGVVHSDLGNLESAVACYRKALELRPDLVEASSNLGLALTDLGLDAEAIACHQRAIALQPQWAELYSNLGGAFQKKGDLTNAVACYSRAIQLRPDLPEAQVNLGNALAEQGKIEEAAPCYVRALELRPDYADAHGALAEVLLTQGDFANGWTEYEWRWHCKRLGSPRFQQPLWEGHSLQGKTILIHAEQGLGDTFQFLRYLPLVKAQGGKVILEVQQSLRQLLADVPGVDQLIGKGDELPPFDVYAPLLSLPRIFRTDLQNIPKNIPYLFPDPSLVQIWRKKLYSVRSFRVGVNWHGRSGRGAHRQRDIPIECFASLAEVPGVRIISLQKGESQQALTACCDPESIVHLGNDIDQEHGAFMDTAAIMSNLDLVISSDTSVPHLAGALGVPVWVALPPVPNWRWLRARRDCPWYPTMQLFRKAESEDWAAVFSSVRAELARLIAIQS